MLGLSAVRLTTPTPAIKIETEVVHFLNLKPPFVECPLFRRQFFFYGT